MDLREIWFGDVDWTRLAQDRDRWRALVNGDEPSRIYSEKLIQFGFEGKQLWGQSREDYQNRCVSEVAEE
jgi:hypothetical protein